LTTTAEQKLSGSISESASASGYYSYLETETLDILKTLDIAAAAAAAGETESKSSESEFAMAAALIVDYDLVVDYDKMVSQSMGGGCEESYEAEWESAVAASETIAGSCTLETESSERINNSENNHIDLEDVSQKKIQAVSNLNAVGAGAAAQANIASNVGVSGTISHSNIATVVSGL
jgi:hypothetical protein